MSEAEANETAGHVVDLRSWIAERGAAEAPASGAAAAQRVLRRLSGRSLSVAEADAALRDAGLSDAGEREQLLEEWAERGYLDDEELAEILVTRLSRRGKAGSIAVARTLRSRGIDPEVIDIALARLDPEDEFQAALAFARTRWQRLERSGADGDRAALGRLAAQLRRRGYSSEVSRRVLGQLRG